MAALQEEEEKSVVGPPHSYHIKAQDYDEMMLMIMVVTKNRRVPNVLINEGLGVNIMINALRKKVGLTNIEAAPFTGLSKNPQRALHLSERRARAAPKKPEVRTPDPGLA